MYIELCCFDPVPFKLFILISGQSLSSDLALDESQCLGAVLVDVLLVGVGIAASAAVWVSSVTV